MSHLTRLLLAFIVLISFQSWGQDSLDCHFTVDSITNIKYVAVPEKEPEFSGGNKNLAAFLATNLELPQDNVC